MKTKRALREGGCPWCYEAVAIGAELFPVLESLCNLSRAIGCSTSGQPTSSRQCFWVHASCAVDIFANLNRPVEPPACRHWLRLGRCPFGTECFFSHPTTEAPSYMYLAPPERRTWGGKRRQLFKPTSSIFRAWLLNTFGPTLLQSGSGVLDIAGGKGELAFELENLGGISTRVVDPRPLTLRSAYLKWKSGHYDKAAANPVLKKYLTHYNRAIEPSYPCHLRVFLDETLIDKVVAYQQGKEDETDSTNDWWQQCRDYAQQQCWTRKGLQAAAESTSAEEPFDDPWLANAPPDVSDAARALSILSDCSVVLGMHPDQATEAAVDLALALEKPFAVVPCCVFSSQFPHRKLRDGTCVRSTDQLIQYLQEKNDRIRVETLGFEGMNRVVFWSPQDIEVG